MGVGKVAKGWQVPSCRSRFLVSYRTLHSGLQPKPFVPQQLSSSLLSVLFLLLMAEQVIILVLR